MGTPERPIGKLERLSYERMQREHELARQGHPRGFWYDPVAGGAAVSWIETYCRHHKGKWRGQRLILNQWQRWIQRELYGWKRPDGTRRFRKLWQEVPKKNGKTETAAGNGMLLLVGDNEPGAEVYTTATAKEQAEICHNAAREMALQSPELNQFVRVPKKKGGNLTCEQLGSKMQILSSDFGTLDGLSPHGDIRDEVHAWKDHALDGVLSTAMGAREQPMTIEVTTAGVYDAQGVGWQHHDYAESILKGEIEDDRQFVFIAAMDEGDDPHDPATWWKANPNLGVSLYPDFLADQSHEAQRNPRKYTSFLQYHLNVWTAVVSRWFDMDRWRSCPALPLDADKFKGALCFGGLDLSRTIDLTCWSNVFILPGDQIAILPRFFIPQERIDEEVKAGKMRLKNWVDAGWLIATPGSSVDYTFVKKQVKDDYARFKHKEIGFDPWNASQTTTELFAEGVPMVEVAQNFGQLSSASKYLEQRVLARAVHHGGHPVLTWNFGNAVAREDANKNIAPDKKRAKDKIDGVSATVTALSRYVLQKPPEKPGLPYLARRGLVRLG